MRLHLLIPAVENAVSGNAFRPGDMVKSRKGLTVEIDNTDAEGRLVLADALTKAGEDEPELIVDFATLTGAARVALGPDLPALFCQRRWLAGELAEAGDEAADPLWRMPLWEPMTRCSRATSPTSANASGSPMAGAVTAALFLKRFVPKEMPWAHFDTYAWRDSGQTGPSERRRSARAEGGFRCSSDRYARVPDQRWRRRSRQFPIPDPDRTCNISATYRFTCRSRDRRRMEPQWATNRWQAGCGH